MWVKQHGIWLVLVGLLAGMGFFQTRGLVSGAPPAIQGNSLDGKAFDLTHLSGRPSIIYFWASWCAVCKAMQGNVQAVATDHPIITLALKSGDAAEVREYMRKEKFSVPVILDESGEMAQRYGIRGVPTVFFLDAGGNISFTASGYTSEAGLRFRLWLAGKLSDRSVR